MIYLASAAIWAVQYDVRSHTLTVWFKSGGRGYDYYNVPQTIYQGLLDAPSKGQYFNRFIRDQYAA